MFCFKLLCLLFVLEIRDKVTSKICVGFPHYLKVKKYFRSWNGVNQGGNYYRAYLANKCTKQMKIKHRLGSKFLWLGADCCSLGRSLAVSLSLLRVSTASITDRLPAKQTLNTFNFPLFPKSENPLWISFHYQKQVLI